MKENDAYQMSYDEFEGGTDILSSSSSGGFYNSGAEEFCRTPALPGRADFNGTRYRQDTMAIPNEKDVCVRARVVAATGVMK